jgi:hypothetical protein
MRRLGALAFLLALAPIAPGSAAGAPGNCFKAEVKKYSFDIPARRSTYTVFRSCFRVSGSNSEQYGMTYKGTWDENTKKATEEVDDHFRYFYDGVQQSDVHYLKTVTADCPSDPWLYDVSCGNPTISPPLPMEWVFYPPYPLSAAALEAPERDYIKHKFAEAQRKAAPEILQPKPNGKYTNGQLLLVAKVRVPDDDDPGAWKVEIETNMDAFQPAPHNIPLKAARVVTGVGTAWIYLDLPYNGFWFARARSTSPKHTSDWSGQVRFEIAGSKGPQFMSIQGDKLNLHPLGTSSTLGPPPLPGPSPAPSPAPTVPPPQRRRSR